jgi:hypothetical protein
MFRVKTRLQVQVQSQKASQDPEEAYYDSTWDALSRILNQDGLRGLYAGINGSLLGVASTNFAYFYWYTVVRTLYVKYARSGTPPSTAIELSLGAVAGALAQVFTIPVAVVTTRQQTAKAADRKGLLPTAGEVIHGPDGVTGLWRGLKASLVLVVNPAITYGAYERLKGALFPGKAKLKPWEAFCECFCFIRLDEAFEVGNKILTSINSSGGHFQISGHDCNPTSHRRQGRTTV